MKAREWDEYLLKERRDFIDDKDALAAFDFLVNAAIRLPDFECRPALQGDAKTFTYKNITSQSRDFAFIVNRKHLRFYVRPSGLKWVPGGFIGLKDQFNDAKETAGEWVVDIGSAPEAARLHSFLFNSVFVELEPQSTTVDNAAEDAIRHRVDIGETEKEQVTREAEIVRAIDQLVDKVVSGQATADDRAKLSELSELRSKLMHPPLSPRFEERRRRFG